MPFIGNVTFEENTGFFGTEAMWAAGPPVLLTSWQIWVVLALGALLVRTVWRNRLELGKGQDWCVGLLCVVSVAGLLGVYGSLYQWLGELSAAARLSQTEFFLSNDLFVEGYRQVSATAGAFFFSSAVLSYAAPWTLYLADTTRSMDLPEVFGLWFLGIFGAISAASPAHVLQQQTKLHCGDRPASSNANPILLGLLAAALAAAHLMRQTHDTAAPFLTALAVIHVALLLVLLAVRGVLAEHAGVPKWIYAVVGGGCLAVQLGAAAAAAEEVAVSGVSWGVLLEKGGWANLPTRGMVFDWACIVVANGTALLRTCRFSLAKKVALAAATVVSPGAALAFALAA